MKSLRCLSICLLLQLASFAAEKISLPNAIEQALQKSQITTGRGGAVHIKVEVSEKDSPESDYRAKIEEYWFAPHEWSRSVTTPEFTEKTFENEKGVSETHTGDYEPHWLRDIETAIFNPLPMHEQLEQLASSMVTLDGNEHSLTSVRWQQRVGTPPAQNTVFSVITFRGDGLLQSIVTPPYSAQFENYSDFANKRVARKIVFDPEPGTQIEADIKLLEPLINPPPDLFFMPPSAPERQPIHTLQISESTARSLIQSAPDIIWPTVRDGKTSGVVSIYVSVDRAGKVRETRPLNSDNPQVNDSVREQLAAWEFKPATSNGVAVQTEAILTFPFQVKIANPIPQLSQLDALKLATHIVEPNFPPHAASPGTVVAIDIFVNEAGDVSSATSSEHLAMPLFFAAYNAVRQWRFHPYMNHGKPDGFKTKITFTVK